ncbi:MAG: hypothetical protein CBE21_00365 [Proteobacteria bacterium TMED261]|nr:MAG: hypothetical protein CBE21_00365 [Proteobacteria bacterium TMED261]|tara:strand:- start:297 stop:779 length:483 start_codon:yes stop_codon:yes gene_type:complete
MPLKVKSRVVTTKKKAKPPARVTLKYRHMTLEKLSKSITLATRRYEGDSSVTSAPNFRIVKENLAEPDLEEVFCSIKVGKKRWLILEDHCGSIVDHIKIAGSDVVSELRGFHNFVSSLLPGSDDAKSFDRLAVDQAWPPADQVQKRLYFYDAENDLILKK